MPSVEWTVATVGVGQFVVGQAGVWGVCDPCGVGVVDLDPAT